MMEANLMKYAYFIGRHAGHQNEWKICDSQSGELKISLTENHHLIVRSDKKIMENVSLWNSNSWMKAVAKGDSMLFVSKYQGAHRRFRVKFSDRDSQTGSDVRKAWCERLRRYFTVNEVQEDGQSSQKEEADSSQSEQLNHEATVANLTKALCGDVKSSLPAIYHQTELPTQSLDTLVSLCLTDINFPAFVDAVDKQINGLLQKTL